MNAQRRRTESFNPTGEEIGVRLFELAARRRTVAEARLPWHRGDVPWGRLIAAIASFTDDYCGPFPEEFFHARHVADVMTGLVSVASTEKRPLRVEEQFAIGLDACGNSAFGAAVTLHAASRTVARGRDTRALPGLTRSLPERLEQGKVFAAFAEQDSRGGDALGDTYHYWAMVVGGLWCGDPRRALSLRARATAAFLESGADLMWLVRDRLFGNTLFFGNHKTVDRLGLVHGMTLAAMSGLR